MKFLRSFEILWIGLTVPDNKLYLVFRAGQNTIAELKEFQQTLQK